MEPDSLPISCMDGKIQSACLDSRQTLDGIDTCPQNGLISSNLPFLPLPVLLPVPPRAHLSTC